MNITCPHCAKGIDVDSLYDDKLLTLLEAAQIIGVHPATLSRWAKEKKITPRRLGNHRNSPMRFDPADVEALKS